MRTLLAIAAWVLLAAGCAATDSAAPEPTGIEPSQYDATAPLAVKVRGQHLQPGVLVDYTLASRSVLLPSFRARVGELELEQVELVPGEGLRAVVPAGLARGVYDLTVTDPAGREGTLPQAFRVVATDESVTSFRLDDVGPQTVGVPFAVGVTALDVAGRTVEAFTGTVSLSAHTGVVTAMATGTFVLGRQQFQVSLSAPDAAQVLQATDAQGRTGASAPFAVVPAPPAALEMLTPPQALGAGDCSEQVRLQIVDAQGAPTSLTAATRLSLDAAPEEAVAFFTDSTCAQPVDRVVLEPGATMLAFRFSSRAAGAVTVRVRSAQLPTVTQVHQVAAGQPAGLRFSAPSPAVSSGACAEAVAVQLVDAFGNLSISPAVLALTVTATPAAAVSIFSDPACAVAGATITLLPLSSEGVFSIRPSAPGLVTLSIQGPGLVGATQAVQVGP